MAVKFANRMNLSKGSEIRALLALTAKPEVTRAVPYRRR